MKAMHDLSLALLWSDDLLRIGLKDQENQSIYIPISQTTLDSEAPMDHSLETLKWLYYGSELR